MLKYDVLLWDVDGTLLDFEAAEAAAISTLFIEFGFGKCSREALSLYSEINRKYWNKLESGEMTKSQILIGRFVEFFEAQGLDASKAGDFNTEYQQRLGDTIAFRDDSFSLVSSLRGRVRQYAVSNGTVAAQTKKLKNSGFDRLMDGVFLSEELGYEKPDERFFEKVFKAIGPVDRRRVMIIGDSLTSDIEGGCRAGIVTCWYAPKGGAAGGLRTDYVISDLREVPGILEG